MDPNEQPEPTLPSAEQMRAKRLAKLGGGNTSSSGAAGASGAGAAASTSASASVSASSSPTSTSPAPADASATPASKITINARPVPASTSTQTAPSGKRDSPGPSSGPSSGPASQPSERDASPSKRPRTQGPPGLAPGQDHPGVSDANDAPARQTDADKPASAPAPAPAPALAPAPPQKTASPVSPEKALADWTNHTISSLLRVTLVDGPAQKDRHGHPLVFLPELKAEVEARGAGLQLTEDDMDGALREAATLVDARKPLLSYLLPVYKAVVHASKLRTNVAARAALLQELRRLCISNIVFALTMPVLFGRDDNEAHDTIVPNLLLGIGSHDPEAADMDFMTDLVARLDDDDEGLLKNILVKAIIDISSQLAKMTMNDQFLPYVEALLTYTRFKPLLAAIASHPRFQMAQSAPNIEKFTILGPFFRLSPLQTEVATSYFGGHRKTELQRKESVYSALQMTLNTHQSNLHTIAMAFARAGDAPRNRLLDWFAYTMNVNHKRRAIQVDIKEVSSDGFMMNVGSVLDRMCEPFIESNFSRMERIEIDYLRRHPRVTIGDETKLNADQAQADAFYANKADGQSKFVSELFFLNTASHYYGMGGLVQKYKDMDRDIKHMESEAAKLEAEHQKLIASGADPQGRAMVTAVRSLRLYDEAIDRYVAYKYASEAMLLDEKMQARALMFTRYASVWLIRIASGSEYTPDKPLTLPLSAKEPEAFSCLPEYALQNIVDHFKFLFRSVPRILPSAVGDEMLALCITFLESSQYIRNPYLKSSLVTLLFSGTWRIYHLANGVLGDALNNSALANKYLLHALMKFYIECESTGASSQFYDKFNIRYEIFQVIKAVWPNDLYKRQLTQQSQTNRAFFVQFVNLLLNDATYVLDEALTKFPKIHELQRELQNPAGLSPEEKQEKESALHQAENQAQSYMQLANETVAMMKLFTEALAEAFTMPEIVHRLAGMLDYNLISLAGPASRNLKVENPEKYYFNPKVLLPQLVELYLNLGSKPAFVEAVASDGRSYKPDVFENATRILTTKNLMDPAKLDAWNVLQAEFALSKEVIDQAETDLGEVPAEFEDPIMGDLMKDPVVLPSKHVVDRSTIVQHLLSDPKDPFTRQPMTVDDVVPDDALKAKIDAWRAERVAAAKKAKLEAAAQADAMDLS